MRKMAIVITVAATALLAACTPSTGGDAETAGTPSATVAASPTDTPEPTTAPTSEPTTGADGGAAGDGTSLYESWEGSPEDVFSSVGFDFAAGGELLLSGLTANDPGTERQVTLEFEGNGAIDWQTRYVEQAIQDGSGFEIDMGDSGAIMQILLRGMRYPEPNETVITAAEAEGMVIRVDPPFEGQSSVFLGVPEAVNYRVELTAPEGPPVLTVTFLGD